MNEQKKSYLDYMNPNMSEQKQNTVDLESQIAYFISHNKISADDWIFLDRMVKQLNKQKFNLSKKVLRSMQSKFESIQQKYQR